MKGKYRPTEAEYMAYIEEQMITYCCDDSPYMTIDEREAYAIHDAVFSGDLPKEDVPRVSSSKQIQSLAEYLIRTSSYYRRGVRGL